MSDEADYKALVIHAGSIPISRSMFEMRPSLLDLAAKALREARDAAPAPRWSDFKVPYIRERQHHYPKPGELIEESEYDGGSWGDGAVEPVRRRRPLPGSRSSRYRATVRIVAPHWRAVKLADDEAAMMAEAKRCACGHLDVFHNHDGEYGVSCSVGDCECDDLRTRLAQ